MSALPEGVSRVDSLLRDFIPTLRCAPAGNDTEVTLRLKLGVIPGEPKAREGDRVQDEVRSSSPSASLRPGMTRR